MARYDVYRDPAGAGYLLDVQVDFVSSLDTRVLAPLEPIETAPLPMSRLNPVFEIEGGRYSMLTQYLATAPKLALGAVVTSLDSEAEAISNALDMLFTGV